MDWQAFDHCIIAKNLSFEFGKDSLNKLIQRFSRIIPNCQESVISKIGEQYDDFKFLIAKKVKTGSIQIFTDVVSCVMKNEDMKELSILLDICGTFQASSADCERGFSLMNSIKTKSRNRLQVNHLDNLMRIKFYLSSGSTIDLDAVYKHWTTHKDRREYSTINE
ncbi:hypothetical protein ACJMK2_037666 [Sinanodonta woodiana]|uniref:HAT C-terminal dimerisation domain-containing protein n=1 Tax=Sinanodonta woodiana TaxID=1069815 RepID=A0ABD3WN06_SINWO